MTRISRAQSRLRPSAVLALIAMAVSAHGQGDVFSTNDPLAGCTPALQAEDARHRTIEAGLTKQKEDVGNKHDKALISCGNSQSCRDAALRDYQQGMNRIAMQESDEYTRYNKALINVRNQQCVSPPATAAPPANSEVLPQIATLPNVNIGTITVEGLKGEVLKRILPNPTSATPVNGDFLGRLLFLRMTPTILASLVNEYQQTAQKVNALRVKKSLTAAQKTQLNDAISYANNVRKAIQQLRVAYTTVYGDLTPSENQTFPTPGELNFPF